MLAGEHTHAQICVYVTIKFRSAKNAVNQGHNYRSKSTRSFYNYIVADCKDFNKNKLKSALQKYL